MKRKVVFELSDFQKLSETLNDLLIPLSQVERAIQIKEIMKKAIVMDIVMDIEMQEQKIRMQP